MNKKMTWRHIATLAADSFRTYLMLVFSHSLHLRRSRLGKHYQLDRGGVYEIFRETIKSKKTVRNPVILVVGFRLRIIRSNPFFHWVFQKVCILTTPFWSGFHGFRVKLWMVDPETKNYLGIYQWYGKENTQTYVNALIRVLRPLSTRGSVWYEMYPDKKLEGYLESHKVKSRHRHSVSIASVLRYYYKSLPAKY
jgi:hypothetical protein